MSNRSGSPYSTPRDANRVPFLTAASTADGITPVVLEADPTTHLLQVSSSGGGGGGTQYAEGATTSPATGNVALGRYSNSTPSLSSNQLESLQLDSSGNLKVKLSGDTTATGTITGSGQSVTIATNSQTSVGIQVSGTFSGTILIKGSVDGTSYTPTSAVALSNGAISSTITSSYTGQANAGGLVSFQLTAITWASGNASVTLVASVANSTVMLDNPLPIGTNSIGTVGLNAGSNAIGSITNTSFTATQATGSNLHTVVDSGTINATISGSISNTSFAATQATASALNATVVGTGTFATQVTSLPSIPAGSNAIGSITNTSFAATQATGTNLHTVTDSGSVTNATLSAETTKVIGTVRTTDGSGNLLTSTTNALDVNIKSGSIANTSFTVTQATGTNLHTVVDSGTVTANIGTTNGLALDATLTGGTQQSKITDGTNIASVVAGDTGYNAIATAGTTKTINFSTTGTGAQIVGPFDVRGYQTIEVVWTAIGTGLAFTAQFGVTAGGNFTTVQAFSTGVNAFTNVLGASIGTIYKSAVWGNYFQLNVTGITAGTATGTLTLRNAPIYSGTIASNVTPSNVTTLAIPGTAMPAGFKALSADQTATTTTYNTQGIVDLVGKQIVMPYSLNQQFVKGANSTTGTTSTALINAVASNSIYLTSVQVMNTGTVTAQILLQDGNAGTTLAYAPAPAGSGSTITFPVPIKNTSGNAWYFASGAASTTIYVSAQGYYGV